MLRQTPIFALLFCLALPACAFLDEPPFESHNGSSPAPTPSPTGSLGGVPSAQATNVCAASVGTCADYTVPRPARPRPSAAVAYVSADEETDLALYADGTLLRMVSPKARGYVEWYWDLGDVRAKVSDATMKDLTARLTAAKNANIAHPFFGAGRGSPEAADLLTFDDGSQACTSTALQLSAPFYCQAPDSLELVRWQLEVLGDAALRKWLDASEGTIALMGEVQPLAWPLDPSLAAIGDHTITDADYATLSEGSVWTLPDGRYVMAGRMKSEYGDGRIDYAVEVMDVETPAIVPDLPATLRSDLLATNGKLGWSSDWLGIDADRSVFPAFKGKRIAVFPKTDADVAHVYRLAAFEHRDLRADGDL